MRAFVEWQGTVVPVDRSDVDTDAILPKQYMKMLGRSGLGPYLFDEWRYTDTGEPGQDCATRPRNLACVFNSPQHQGATILLACDNFGCGSSREHAPWALDDYGIRVLIASSFGDIFYSNCLKNGLLPIALPRSAIEQLFQAVQAAPRSAWRVSLTEQCVSLPSGDVFRFDIAPFAKTQLLLGQDEIGRTLQQRDAIKAYEARQRRLAPWLFAD